MDQHCRTEHVNGVPVRVRGGSPLTDTDKHYLDAIIRAAQDRFTKESPMKYRYKPRKVEAAQWNPRRPGGLIGMLANHDDIAYERKGDRIDVSDYDVEPGWWVVIDGDHIDVFSDEVFRDRFEARITRGSTPSAT